MLLSYLRIGWFRVSPLEVFVQKNILKMCSKFTGEHPYRSVILIKLQSNIIEITLWHGCSPVNLLNLLNIFRTLFPKSTYGHCLWKAASGGK